MSTDKIVFVTGASGFVGSHVVQILLDAGYSVRAAIRPPKLDKVRKDYAGIKAFEAVEVSDIVNGQFPEALKGVYAVIHLATPLPGKVPADELFAIAIEGSLNILRQAERAGIKKIVLTSSIAAVSNPKFSFTDQDYSAITKEEAFATTDPLIAYAAAKAYAEKAVWAWVDEHPHVEVATIAPSYLYGSFAHRYSLPTPDYDALATNIAVYNLLKSDGAFIISPAHADVRDAARAHVALLDAPPTSQVGRKRLIFSSPHGCSCDSVLNLIKEKRPGLKDTLITRPAPVWPVDKIPVDFARIEQLTGMKKEDFHTLEETILDAVDDLVALEARWVAKGYAVTSIPAPDYS